MVYCTLDILKECLTFMYLTLRNEISEKYDQVREENSRGRTFVTSLCNKNLYFILIDRAMSFFIIGMLHTHSMSLERTTSLRTGLGIIRPGAVQK